MAFYHYVKTRACKKRKSGMGGKPMETTLGGGRKKKIKVKGGKSKLKTASSKKIGRAHV